MMREAGDSADGVRLRALIVILWRAGLRIGETLDLSETDLGPSRGATAGRHWESSLARKPLARTGAKAGVCRRFAPRQLRHAHAVEMAHEGVPLVVIQRQVGHANLGVTSICLRGSMARRSSIPSIRGPLR